MRPDCYTIPATQKPSLLSTVARAFILEIIYLFTNCLSNSGLK